MKKNVIILLLAAVLVLCAQPVFAADQSEIECLEDGGYFITTMEDQTPLSIIPLALTTKTKSKTVTYYNSADKPMWFVKVTGTFTYGNGSATCKNATVSTGSHVAAWKISSKSASKNANKAIGRATAKRYLNGHVVETKPKTVTLTCSPKGNFS